MKSQSIVATLCALCASAVMLISSTAFAQIESTFGPKEPISLTVTFEGSEADRLTGAQVYFELSGERQSDQLQYSGELNINQSKQVSPGVFVVSGNIPENAATGSYQLNQVRGIVNGGSIIYSKELPTLTVTVKNSLVLPKLKSVTLNPKN